MSFGYLVLGNHPIFRYVNKYCATFQEAGNTVKELKELKELGYEVSVTSRELYHLKNLLAVIHRDGGHFTEDNGLEKSVEVAMQIVTDTLVEKEEKDGKSASIKN